VVGVPGAVVGRTNPNLARDAPDLNHTSLPDLIGVTVTSLMERVEALEQRINGHAAVAHPHVPEAGAWRGEDFSI
jgi:hypothetical protein